MKFIFLSILFSSWIQADVIISEKAIIERLDETPSLLSLRERLISAEKLQGSLRRSFLPQVRLIYGREKFSTGPFHGKNQAFGGVQAEVNVFNSGRDVLENKVRNKEAELAELNLSIIKARVVSQARIALAEFVYLSELLKIVEEAISLNAKNILGAKKRINAGLATSTDLIDFKQQKVALLQEMESIKYEQGVMARLLATLLGIDPKERIIAKASNQHPDHHHDTEPRFGSEGSQIIQKANIFSEIAELQKETAQRWWSPSLVVYSYALRFTQKEREFPEPEQRNDVTFGFKFTFPIFDGGEGIQEASARAALARAAEYELRQKSLEVEKETLDAMKKLELAHTLIHGAEESVELMTEYRLAIINEYTKGVKNSPDVLQATQRWIAAKNKFAEVKKNYQIAKAEALYLESLTEN